MKVFFTTEHTESTEKERSSGIFSRCSRWFFLLLPLFSLFAAPVGNPAAPALLDEGLFIPDTSWTNIQVGYTQEFLIQKLFRPSRTSPLQAIRKASLSGNVEIAQVTWNIRERLNLQLEAGPGTFEWSWREAEQKWKGKSGVGFFGAGNGALILLEIKDTTLAAEGQVGGWGGAKAKVTLDGASQPNPANTYFYYWQAGASLTQKIGLFAPYLGCLVNQTILRVKHIQGSSARLRSLIITGPFVGCTIGAGTKASLNAEWRGWFEEGLSLSCQVRF